MFVHGDNLSQKEEGTKKYSDKNCKESLNEIRKKYEEWKDKNLKLIGPTKEVKKDDFAVITKRVELLEKYKDFIESKKYAEMFDSRSNLQSTVLEEFMYYLFKDLVAQFSDKALIGKAHTFKDIFFLANNFKEMLKNPSVKIEKKDHDFVIGTTIKAEFSCNGENRKDKEEFQMPAIAIECKTYLDKTMLEGSSGAAEQLKGRNPNAIYIVVAEWLKLTEAINLNKYKVDQIYVIRKQKNTDREFRLMPTYHKNPISPDVVMHLFNLVRDHLTKDWQGSIQFGLQRGWLK